MEKNDIFSTIVETNNLSTEMDSFQTHLEGWIAGGRQVNKSDKFEAIYQTLTESDKKLNQSEILTRLTEFRKYLNTLPVIELTIAFEPDDYFKDQVLRKLKEGSKGAFLVKFKVDREIIAGCKVNFNGKFQDYSLLKTLEESKEAIFGEILRGIK